MSSTFNSRVDGISTSTALKAPCRVATTANITLHGVQSIDGVSVVAGDRVLVKSQTDGIDNGIWICGISTWQRAEDFDGSRDVVQGTRVYINSGSTYAGFEATVTTANPIVIGTTSLSFTLLNIVDASLATDIETVAGIAADVTTVAGIPADVTSVAGISSDVATVAGVSANVTTVAGIAPDVTTVAGIASEISEVASNYPTRSLEFYGAVADGVALDDVAITATSTTLTSATAAFTAADIGKAILIWRAGTSGQPHFTTIASINSPTSVEVTDAAITTVSDKRAVYGTDNASAIQDALDAGGSLSAKAGIYMTSSLTIAAISHGGRKVFPGLIGQGKDKTRFVKADNTDPFWTSSETGVYVYMGMYSGFTVEGSSGLEFGDSTETLADGSGQAANMGGIFNDLVFLDNSTSGGSGGAIGSGIGLKLTKCFNTVISNCDFNAVGYGIVNTGCDNTLVLHNRFNSCRYGSLWDRSAQTFGNGVAVIGNYFVGESEATAMALKSTNRKIVVRDNEFEVSNVDYCFDFSGVDWPAWFGSNADTGPYTITVEGNGVDIGVAAGGRSYRINVTPLFSIKIDNQRWAGEVAAEFVEGSTVVTSVPVLVNGTSVHRLTLGAEGANFGDEWSYYAPENAYAPRDSAVMHFGGRTVDAVWPGWDGNTGIRFAGDSLIIPIAYNDTGLFLIADFSSDIGNEKLFSSGDTFEIAFLARTDDGADTLTCQYQYHNGAAWAPDTATSHALNTDWTLCVHTFVAGSGTSHGVLFDRTTAVGNIQIRSVNVRTLKQNPQFSVRFGSDVANQTGDGTAYTVICASEIVDDGGVYNTGTGVFTAPQAGQYKLSAKVSVASVGAGHTNGQLDIVTSNRTYRAEFNPAAIVTSNNRSEVSMTVSADMDAGDTAYIVVTAYNSTKTVGVAGGATSLTYFNGALIPSGGLV